MSVLDVGSGTGDDTRQIAGSVGPTGRVVGLDQSTDMIEEARRRAADTPGSIEFVEGDALALKFADASFDRTRTERMLIHVADPVAAIGEMVRVTKPGGLVVASDIDGGTIFINSSNKELASAIILGAADDLANGWIGRRIHKYFAEAGLEEIRCVTTVIQNSVGFMRRVFGNRLQHMAATGQTTAEAVDHFWAELDEGERAGWLCSGVVCFTVAGRKPAYR
jgi:ubiquinone/menaquinone biosynthesis C-methylase UbiE